MESRLQRTIEAAEGYLNLGLPEEAEEELRHLPQAVRNHESVLRIQIRIFLEEGHTRKAGILLKAHDQGRDHELDSEMEYLWARYLARSQDFDLANQHLIKAILLDRDNALHLLDHPDLREIWEWVARQQEG